MVSSEALWSQATAGSSLLNFCPGKNSITFPPAAAVFSIASKTVYRLNVYAWQPMKNPPVLYSSGIFVSAWAERVEARAKAIQQEVLRKRVVGFISKLGLWRRPHRCRP